MPSRLLAAPRRCHRARQSRRRPAGSTRADDFERKPQPINAPFIIRGFSLRACFSRGRVDIMPPLHDPPDKRENSDFGSVAGCRRRPFRCGGGSIHGSLETQAGDRDPVHINDHHCNWRRLTTRSFCSTGIVTRAELGGFARVTRSVQGVRWPQRRAVAARGRCDYRNAVLLLVPG